MDITVWIEKIIIKVFCPICNRTFPVSAINEHADACLEKQTTQTTICITSDDEGENLEQNNSQTINHNNNHNKSETSSFRSRDI